MFLCVRCGLGLKCTTQKRFTGTLLKILEQTRAVEQARSGAQDRRWNWSRGTKLKQEEPSSQTTVHLERKVLGIWLYIVPNLVLLGLEPALFGILGVSRRRTQEGCTSLVSSSSTVSDEGLNRQDTGLSLLGWKQWQLEPKSALEGGDTHGRTSQGVMSILNPPQSNPQLNGPCGRIM